MKKNHLLAGLFVLASGAFLQSCSNAKADTRSVNLKFNLSKGGSYSYIINVDSKTQAQGQVVNSLVRFEYNMDVTDEVNGIKTIKATYKRIAMKMEMPNGKMEIDTDMPSDSASEANPMSMMSAMFSAMKDKSFEMKVDSTGSIIEVNGVKDLMTSMVSDMHLPGEREQMIKQMFSNQFNDESIKQTFSQSFNIYPGKQVKVGDKWDKKVTMNLGPVNMEMNTNYTVKEINDKTVKLELASDIHMNESKGTQTGTFDVDAKTGMVLNGEIDQEFDAPSKSTSHTKIAGRKR